MNLYLPNSIKDFIPFLVDWDDTIEAISKHFPAGPRLFHHERRDLYEFDSGQNPVTFEFKDGRLNAIGVGGNRIEQYTPILDELAASCKMRDKSRSIRRFSPTCRECWEVAIDKHNTALLSLDESGFWALNVCRPRKFLGIFPF
jgi:hypothetical protein